MEKSDKIIIAKKFKIYHVSLVYKKLGVYEQEIGWVFLYVKSSGLTKHDQQSNRMNNENNTCVVIKKTFN